jgi:uncharacterized protein
VSTLRERLDRMRRERPLPPPAPSRASDSVQVQETEALSSLEQTLLGESGVGLSLKVRLERLVAVAAQKARQRCPEHARLEELVPGQVVSNEHGSCYVVEERRPLDLPHGEVPLARLRALSADGVRTLTAEPDLDGFEPQHAVYLDTETTGLAGGSGTAAFLIGIGFVEGDEFCVRQYFMRDYDEEPAMLWALAQDLRGCRQLVTFNGKMFDCPLLETRFRLGRRRFPLAEARHLDLLHPARRLWKARLDSCRLVMLESALLRVSRVGDIPGAEIPQAYFDFVRDRDARRVARILDHNRQDIVSLAALTALACQWVQDETLAEDPRDVFSVARVFERAELHERSEAAYQRVLAEVSDEESAVRRAALLRLAARRKRAGEHAEAARFWRQAMAAGDLDALRELAMFLEHRQRDWDAALQLVEEGLARVADDDDSDERVTADLLRRRDRLRAKLAHT